jgi:predicted acyl esterase
LAAYWQSLIPYKEEFSRISTPVLQTAGYYYGGPGAAVYYLTEHAHYRPDAEHYLIIGPYDHLMAQRGTATGKATSTQWPATSSTTPPKSISPKCATAGSTTP